MLGCPPDCPLTRRIEPDSAVLQVKRGEIRTMAGAADYAGKPRPAVIVQDDLFEATSSVTICAFTTDPTEAPLLRIVIEPSEGNGLLSTVHRELRSRPIRRSSVGRAAGC